MKKFVIEREIPNVGELGQEQLRATAAKSNQALRQLGPGIQWQESYITADKTFCIYLAKMRPSSGVTRSSAGSRPAKLPKSARRLTPRQVNKLFNLRRCPIARRRTVVNLGYPIALKAAGGRIPCLE